MHEFPFSEDEWKQVQEASHVLLNATLSDDRVLQASSLLQLQQVLNVLRARYGEHPVLIETEADFLDDPSMRLKAYRAAIRLAENHSLSTLSIRLSLASMLLEDYHDVWKALVELQASLPELERVGDEYEREKWNELFARCRELDDGV